MKTKFVFFLFLVCPLLVLSQTFQRKKSWRDNSFQQADAHWVDMDNDSLLDVIVTGNNHSQQWQLKSYENKWNTSFVSASSITYPYPVSNIAFTDNDRDGFIDIAALVRKQNGALSLTSFINKKDFAFTPVENIFPVASASQVQFADINNDGRPDLLSISTNGLKIAKATPDGFTNEFEAPGLIISGIAIHDFTKDGQLDIVVSAIDGSSVPVLFILNNKGNFRFDKKIISNTHKGIIETGDINHDWLFDFIVSGTDESNNRKIVFYTNSTEGFKATASIDNHTADALFLADFNSDGLVDLYFDGKHENGQRFNFIRQNDQTLVPLDAPGIVSQRFGDYDRDGDLDLLRVVDSSSYHVFQIFENTTVAKNASPSVPTISFAIATPYHTIINWKKSNDDHTPAAALTYDLILTTESGSQIITPEFNSASRRRRSMHGHQSTNSFAIVKELTDQRYNYQVQAVDNAFNGSKCSGVGGISPCFEIKHEYVQACKNDKVTLTATETADWFSLSGGLIYSGTMYEFVATATDTLYSFVPQLNDCSKSRIWVIHVNDGPTSEKETKYVCENKEFKIGVQPGWLNPQWRVNQETAKGDSITLKLDAPQKAIFTGSNGKGCTYIKEFQLNISKPVLSMINDGENLVIPKGQAISLQASGADTYVWKPAIGLNNSRSADPVASPTQTTEYEVTAADSVGCMVTKKITVHVEELGFIPTLFTPNGDGKNDEVKVYGITNASHFKFSIFNREGSAVYETTDVQQATQSGWNGTHKGTPQASGLYYWKLEGKSSAGQPITLNGKSNGSILLVK
jgi:gliding motility-associated-like protein